MRGSVGSTMKRTQKPLYTVELYAAPLSASGSRSDERKPTEEPRPTRSRTRQMTGTSTRSPSRAPRGCSAPWPRPSQGKVDVVCQDLLHEPLDRQVDVIVSAMATHHVDDTAGLLRTLFGHLRPGGRLALADLDAKDGSFHPPEAEGVFHQGFDREALGSTDESAGYVDISFLTACNVKRGGRGTPVSLLTATRPA